MARRKHKINRRPSLKREVDGSLIPNSQKVSPSLDEIARLCDEFQRNWDEETEMRRRAYPAAGKVVYTPVKVSAIRESVRWFKGEERWDDDTDR
jgi:hypothetical protein